MVQEFDNATAANTNTSSAPKTIAGMRFNFEMAKLTLKAIEDKYGPTPDVFVMLKTTFEKLKNHDGIAQGADVLPNLNSIPIHLAVNIEHRAAITKSLRKAGLRVQEITEQGE